MLRWLKTIVVMVWGGVIVALWLGCAGIWIRSYWRGDAILSRSLQANSEDPSREKVRTLLVLSGDGGLLLGSRHIARSMILVHSEPLTRWSTYDSPTYPQPTKSFFTGAMVLTNVSLSPTTQPGKVVAGLSANSGTIAIYGSGSGIAVTVNGAAPTTLAAGTAVTLSSGQTFTLAPAGSVQMSAPGGGSISASSLWIQTASPTTMGSAFDDAAISPPPVLPPGTRQFFAYETGTPFSDDGSTGDMSRVIVFPYWALMIALSLLMYLPLRPVLRMSIQRRRRRVGCCPQCGYDLRATPERCPECGAEVITSATGNKG